MTNRPWGKYDDAGGCDWMAIQNTLTTELLIEINISNTRTNLFSILNKEVFIKSIFEHVCEWTFNEVISSMN